MWRDQMRRTIWMLLTLTVLLLINAIMDHKKLKEITEQIKIINTQVSLLNSEIEKCNFETFDYYEDNEDR